MITQNLITDLAIEIVFENTNFSEKNHRQIVDKSLAAVEREEAISHTCSVILEELGLVKKKPMLQEYWITAIGKKYLELLKKDKQSKGRAIRNLAVATYIVSGSLLNTEQVKKKIQEFKEKNQIK